MKGVLHRMKRTALVAFTLALAGAACQPVLAWTPAMRAELVKQCFAQMPLGWQQQVGEGGLKLLQQAAAAVKLPEPKADESNRDYAQRLQKTVWQSYEQVVNTALESKQADEGLEAFGTLAGLVYEALMPVKAVPAQAASSEDSAQAKRARVRKQYAADCEKLLPELQFEFGRLEARQPSKLVDEMEWAWSYGEAVEYAYASGLRVAVLRSITKAVLLKACTTAIEAWLAAIQDVSEQLKGEYYLVKAAKAANKVVLLQKRALLLPLRQVVELAGCQLVWNAEEGRAYVVRGEHWAAVKPGERTALLDGKSVKFKPASRLVEGVLYVPGQFAEDFLGLKLLSKPSCPLVLVEDPKRGKREYFAVKVLEKAATGWFWWWPF